MRWCVTNFRVIGWTGGREREKKKQGASDAGLVDFKGQAAQTGALKRLCTEEMRRRRRRTSRKRRRVRRRRLMELMMGDASSLCTDDGC